MPKKVLVLLPNGLIGNDSDRALFETDASSTASASKLVLGTASGNIDPSWIAVVPFSALPVAADGEVSSIKVVRADDSRLGNPTLQGDVTGTAANTLVVRLRGIPISTTTPTNAQVLSYNQSLNQWVPVTISTGGSLTVTDGTTSVSNVTTLVADQVIDMGSNTAKIVASGSGGESIGGMLYLYHTFR